MSPQITGMVFCLPRACQATSGQVSRRQGRCPITLERERLRRPTRAVCASTCRTDLLHPVARGRFHVVPRVVPHSTANCQERAPVGRSAVDNGLSEGLSWPARTTRWRSSRKWSSSTLRISAQSSRRRQAAIRLSSLAGQSTPVCNRLAPCSRADNIPAPRSVKPTARTMGVVSLRAWRALS